MALEYFSRIFTKEAVELDPVLNCVRPRVTADHNVALMRPFAAEEAQDAVFSMNPDKSAGVDGFNPGFYQQHWDIVGADVIKACLQWIQQREIPDNLNNTVLVMIPKKKEPDQVTDLRPIALCNVVYKVMSKLLAHQLKCILPDIV